MTYRPEDYTVTDVRSYEDGGMAFDVTIKGADFIIYRHMNKFQPTPIFKFNTKNGLKFNEEGIATGNVEIDWHTCFKGMQHIAEQMTELTGITFKVIPGVSWYSRNARVTQFKEVEA